MKVESSSISHDQPIPDAHAFGKPDPETHIGLSDNRSPHLAWSDVPEGTRSFAVVCVDPDAPTVADDVNQEGKVVSADLPRADFYHWALVDLPASVTELAEGAFSTEVTPGGKTDAGLHGSRQGVNNYTDWFAGDDDMKGDYVGYDGPCPPWNDARVHHYHFTVYALDVEKLELPGRFGAPEVLAAIEGHVLGEARITGTYTNDPALR